MRKLAVIAAVFIFVASCTTGSLLRPCSATRPCDARPASYKAADRAEKRQRLSEGSIVFVYVGGEKPVRKFVVRRGKLVAVK